MTSLKTVRGRITTRHVRAVVTSDVYKRHIGVDLAERSSGRTGLYVRNEGRLRGPAIFSSNLVQLQLDFVNFVGLHVAHVQQLLDLCQAKMRSIGD